MITWGELDDDSKRLFVEASFESSSFQNLLRNLPGGAIDIDRAIAATVRLVDAGLTSIHELVPGKGWVSLDAPQAIEAVHRRSNWLNESGSTREFAADITQRGEDMMTEAHVRLESTDSGISVVWGGPEGDPSPGRLRMD